ncbi:MAG TPA: AraC family transcriptional regulator [Polyangiales bacterium]|nr:AraC family transcriptional regulator [Polyangiales bacterium]
MPEEAVAPLDAMDPDDRLPITAVHELLEGAISLTQDVDLGLKAAREIRLGDYGAVEYAARSAQTWGEAADVVARYLRLLNGALRFSVLEEGEQALIHLSSSVALPRAAADFQSGAFHISGTYLWPPDFSPTFEVWFTHPQPANTDEYERTFAGGTMHFAKPWSGFIVPRDYLSLPVPSADPQLHSLIRKHADSMLAELPRAQSLTERVRDLLANELSGGSPTAKQIARKVAMSERSLARHLQEEGTTFSALLEDLRRRMALRYVRHSELSFSEITFLLGFSQAAAFYRAFRRWTGQTPLEYRISPKTPLDGLP